MIIGNAMKYLPLLIAVLLLGVAGCHDEDTTKMRDRPRLVTFSPALTGLVFDMGLGGHVSGVTTYCQLPAGERRAIVGDSLNIRVEPILAARPDVILTQVDPKQFETVTRADPRIRIESFQIETMAQLADAMARIGQLVGQAERGQTFKTQFLDRLEKVRKRTETLPRPRVLFVMGYQQPLSTGAGTFVDEMIELAGGVNVLRDRYTLWKRPTVETIIELKPDIVICQCTPQEQPAVLDYWPKLLGANCQVIALTDIKWIVPGLHLADYTEKLARMIHPKLAIDLLKP